MTGWTGLSSASRCTRAIEETIDKLGWSHWPKMVCFWFKCVVGT
jgi:hypothetical protein